MGRGSANSAIAVVLALLVLSCSLFQTQAAVYTVGGGRSGWTFNMVSWTNGKAFRAGDVLVFNYDRTLHNVVPVSRGGYSSCSAKGAKVLQSGRDRVKLAKGQNYFICSFAGHCQSGMKIAVTAV